MLAPKTKYIATGLLRQGLNMLCSHSGVLHPAATVQGARSWQIGELRAPSDGIRCEATPDIRDFPCSDRDLDPVSVWIQDDAFIVPIAGESRVAHHLIPGGAQASRQSLDPFSGTGRERQVRIPCGLGF